MAIGIGHIGLDVVDGRAIHEVGTEHIYNRCARGVEVDATDAHRREADGVRAERRARGPHAHAHVASQHGRPHRRARGSMLVGREAPYEPEEVELLEAAQCVGIAVARLEDYRAFEALYKAALLGDAELRAEGRAKGGYGGKGHFFFLLLLG